MSHHVFGDGGLGNLDTQFQATRRECAAHASAGCCGSSSGSDRGPVAVRRADLACRSEFSTSNKPKPLRRHATTVSALTIIRADFHSPHRRSNQTQKIRSAGVSFNRFGAERRKTASCCRKARFSSRSWLEVLNIEASAPCTLNRG